MHNKQNFFKRKLCKTTWLRSQLQFLLLGSIYNASGVLRAGTLLCLQVFKNTRFVRADVEKCPSANVWSANVWSANVQPNSESGDYVQGRGSRMDSGIPQMSYDPNLSIPTLGPNLSGSVPETSGCDPIIN